MEERRVKRKTKVKVTFCQGRVTLMQFPNWRREIGDVKAYVLPSEEIDVEKTKLSGVLSANLPNNYRCSSFVPLFCEGRASQPWPEMVYPPLLPV